MEISLEYWNELAKQTILISSLLSGFSITIVANLLVSDNDGRLNNLILKTATLSAGCFLVTVFSMVQVSMITTPGGFIQNVVASDFAFPRTVGILSLMVGIVALTAMISMAGWTKSKKVGQFTTAVGIITLILLLTTMVSVG